MPKDISHKIIQEIKQKKIKPKTKLELSFKYYSFWLILFLLIVLGIISLSFALLNIININSDIRSLLNLGKFFRIFILTAPYLWISLSLLTFGFGLMAFKKTKKGYRYSLLSVISGIIVIVLAGGILAHLFKIDARLDQQFSRKIPPFQRFSPNKGTHWLQPKEGVLAGEIIELNPKIIYLKSFWEEEWEVHYSDQTIKDTERELIIGDHIGIIGEKIADFVFEARFIKTKFLRQLPPPPRKNHLREDPSCLP